jgi:4a-hydroxytetrahydrobiopterin dehydratase
MPRLLTDTEIDERLAALPGWRRDGDTIRRSVEARDFPTAIAIVDDVAVQAEKADHHPDIDIRWRTLHFTLSTHSKGGLTMLDMDLARHIDTAVTAHD